MKPYEKILRIVRRQEQQSALRTGQARQRVVQVEVRIQSLREQLFQAEQDVISALQMSADEEARLRFSSHMRVPEVNALTVRVFQMRCEELRRLIHSAEAELKLTGDQLRVCEEEYQALHARREGIERLQERRAAKAHAEEKQRDQKEVDEAARRLALQID